MPLTGNDHLVTDLFLFVRDFCNNALVFFVLKHTLGCYIVIFGSVILQLLVCVYDSHIMVTLLDSGYYFLFSLMIILSFYL